MNWQKKWAKCNFENINDELADMECDEDGLNIGKLWKLRNKLCLFKKYPPTVMLDPNGNRITSASNLKEHTINHYKKVLENRTIKPGLESLQTNKQKSVKRQA